jgi:hypothetical protein
MEELISSKYTFVCDPDECDCLIEVTSSDGFGFPSGVTKLTCPCGRDTTLLSVVHATIQPNQTKEEKMETTTTPYNPNLLVTYKKIAGTYAAPESPEYVTDKVTNIEWALDQARKSNDINVAYNNKVNKLENVIISYAQDADEEMIELIKEIANIFDIELTKEIEIYGTMSFTATITVPLTEEYDLESIASDELQVTSWGGNTDVTDYSVDDVRES